MYRLHPSHPSAWSPGVLSCRTRWSTETGLLRREEFGLLGQLLGLEAPLPWQQVLPVGIGKSRKWSKLERGSLSASWGSLPGGRAGGGREVRSTGWGQGLLSLIHSPKLDGAAFLESDGATHARHVTLLWASEQMCLLRTATGKH